MPAAGMCRGGVASAQRQAMDTVKPPESPHKGKTGFRRVLNAFYYSADGLRAALRTATDAI